MYRILLNTAKRDKQKPPIGWLFLSAAIENNGIPFQVKHNNNFSLEQAISDSRNKENLHGPFTSAQAAVASMLED